jgi:hypothetical protein
LLDPLRCHHLPSLASKVAGLVVLFILQIFERYKFLKMAPCQRAISMRLTKAYAQKTAWMLRERGGACWVSRVSRFLAWKTIAKVNAFTLTLHSPQPAPLVITTVHLLITVPPRWCLVGACHDGGAL